MSTPAGLGIGYAPYLLQHLQVLAADNNPSTKVTPTGFLRMLLENNPSLNLPEYEKLKLSNQQGNIRNVQLSYLRRITPDQIDTADDCDNDYIPVYSEMTLSTVAFRKFGFYISDDTIARYMEEASQTVALGQPATPFMQEHLDTLMTVVNGMVGAINQDVLGMVNFGTNVVTGSATPTTVNINTDATVNDLSNGVTRILTDALENEVFGDLLIAGNGLFNAVQVQRSFSGLSMAGIDAAKIGGYKWYYDPYTASKWAANQIGAFSKGTIGFVDIDKYIGFRSGTKGISTFFRIPLPVAATQNDGTVDLMTFDAQLRYIDCPTQIYSGYGGGNDLVTVNRGWQLIISKNFGLFQLPADAYQSSDRLYGNNGALAYAITNNPPVTI